MAVTTNTVVQAAWGILLANWLDRDDVVFGATVSGRPADLNGAEEMVGLFINTIPVRVRLTPDDTLCALLARLQAEQTALLEHHHVGLTEIHAVAGSGADFDTLTVFESYPVDSAALAGAANDIAGIRVTGVTGSDATHYPLSLTISADAALHFTLKYDAGVFTHAQIDGLARRPAARARHSGNCAGHAARAGRVAQRVRTRSPRADSGTRRGAGGFLGRSGRRCGGRESRWCGSGVDGPPVLVSGGGRGGVAVGAPVGREGCGPGVAGGGGAATQPGQRGGDLGDRQDRCRVRAGGSELSRGADRAHAHRLRGDTGCHQRWHDPAGYRNAVGAARRGRQHARCGVRTGVGGTAAPGVCHLHLRFHRPAEGRGGDQRRSRQPRGGTGLAT